MKRSLRKRSVKRNKIFFVPWPKIALTITLQNQLFFITGIATAQLETDASGLYNVGNFTTNDKNYKQWPQKQFEKGQSWELL